jgi:hypothetical protein
MREKEKQVSANKSNNAADVPMCSETKPVPLGAGRPSQVLEANCGTVAALSGSGVPASFVVALPRSAAKSVGCVSVQLRQICTCACPARSPAECSPPHTRRVSS